MSIKLYAARDFLLSGLSADFGATGSITNGGINVQGCPKNVRLVALTHHCARGEFKQARRFFGHPIYPTFHWHEALKTGVLQRDLGKV